MLNVLTNLTVSISFYSNFDTFEIFKKFQLFFQKRQLFSFKEQNFWKFWVFSIFQSHSTAKLLLLAFFKNSRFFSKNHCFCKKTLFLNIFGKFSISVAFYDKVALFSDSQKTKRFLQNFSCIFSEMNWVLNILTNLIVSNAFYSKFATLKAF